MSTKPHIGILLTLLAIVLHASSVHAQLTDNPADIPLPTFPYSDPHRAVIINVHFNSSSDVVLEEVKIANTRARTAIGAPALLKLELLDKNQNILAIRNAWHPLWERHWDSSGETENSTIASSGKGAFFVPLEEALHSVRIIDGATGLTLLVVDVSSEVTTYCMATPDTPICKLFLDGFED